VLGPQVAAWVMANRRIGAGLAVREVGEKVLDLVARAVERAELSRHQGAGR
jgi:hypothetical protein